METVHTERICEPVSCQYIYMDCTHKIHMKKVLPLIILLMSAHCYGAPCQDHFLRYGIYYGDLSTIEVRAVDWSNFDLMILHPGTSYNDYKKLKDDAFLLMVQEMKNSGVSVFFYLDVGCEKDLGGKHYSETERGSWIDFKKREINLFMRYADGVFLDCVGPRYEGRVYTAQFGRDVQALVDHVHYDGGEVIVGDLWALMDWVDAGNLDVIPYEADYVLFKGAWSLTPDQYSDDWNPFRAISFARANNLKILGLDFGDENDETRLMFCYCASKVFGFYGFYYTEGNFYEGVNVLDVPDMGLPQGEYRGEEGGRYMREFKNGEVYVDFQTHRGWIEGEAAEETDFGVLLVVVGVLLGLFVKKRKAK